MPEQDDTTEAEEVAGLTDPTRVPPRAELVDGLDLVAGAIASLDGGVNGLNPYQGLGIRAVQQGELEYTLTDRETGDVQRFRVTIEPIT